MIATLVEVTLRGVLGRRRTLLIALLAAVPVLIAALVRIGGSTSDGATLTAHFLDLLDVATVLPLVALVFGTAVLGSELEDGTGVYLLVKPVERWRIVAAKLLVAAGVTFALVFPTTLLAGLLVGAGRGGELVAIGFAIAVALGSVVYASAFVALSVLTGRALIAGLIYMFIWEALLGGLLAGTALLSVRQYVLAIAHAVAGNQGASITSAVDLPGAIVLSAAVVVIAFGIAVWRLARWEVRTAE